MLACGGGIRLDAERLACFGDRVIDLPLQPISDRQVAMRFAVARRQVDHPPQVRNRFLQPVLRAEEHRKVEVGVRVLGIEGDRALVFAHRVSRLPGRQQSIREVEADAIVVRFEFERGLQGKIDEAIAEAREALRIQPDSAAARQHLDRLLAMRGQR